MFVESPEVDALISGLLLGSLGLMWVVLLVRLNGLRSFSKMTNFDFAMTVAVGSLLAGMGQATSLAGWLQAATAMAALFMVQATMSALRVRSASFERVIGNEPRILAFDGKVDEQALKHHGVTHHDLVAKLREANVLDLSDVRAVVLEATGDISVLHGSSLQQTLLEGTRSGTAGDRT